LTFDIINGLDVMVSYKFRTLTVRK